MAWKCRRCWNVLPGNQPLCHNFIKAIDAGLTHAQIRAAGGPRAKVRCCGSQVATWGGYAYTLREQYEGTGRRGKLQRAGAGSKAMRRLAQLAAGPEELQDEERLSKIQADRDAAKDTLVRDRKHKKQKRAAKIAAKVVNDETAWACAYCWQEPTTADGKPQDTLNFGVNLNCYKCGRERQVEDNNSLWRWYCPNCTRGSEGIGSYTQPFGRTCRDCNYEVTDDQAVRWWRAGADRLRHARGSSAGKLSRS